MREENLSPSPVIVIVPLITPARAQAAATSIVPIPPVLNASIISLSDVVKQDLKFGDLVTELIIKVRKYKAVNNMSMKEEINKLIIKCNDNYINFLKQTELDLKACTGAREIDIISSNGLEIIIE